MNAVPVIIPRPARIDVSTMKCRTTACSANTPTQPRMSHIRPVSWELIIVPPMMMIHGMSQSKKPDVRSVKWYGGAMLAQGNSSRITTMPKFDGFMKCRIRPRTGARRIHFAATATVTPNIMTSTRSLT